MVLGKFIDILARGVDALCVSLWTFWLKPIVGTLCMPWHATACYGMPRRAKACHGNGLLQHAMAYHGRSAGLEPPAGKPYAIELGMGSLKSGQFQQQFSVFFLEETKTQVRGRVVQYCLSQ